MVVETEPNAVLRRLARLRAQYETFAENPHARLLRWRIADDERRMVDALVAMENHEELMQTADLWVPLHSPFESADEHGWVLRRELVAEYERARADEPAGVMLAWAPPPTPRQTNDIDALITLATSLAEYHGDLMEHLTLVLQPPSIADTSAWSAWLARLVPRLPAEIRVIVPDAIESALLDELATTEPLRVLDCTAALDMDGAYLELSEGTDAQTSPAAELRRAFVRMMVAGRHGDVEAAVGIGLPALATATREGWWEQVATLHFGMGALYDDADELESAREHYQGAYIAGARARGQSEAAAGPIRVHARMAGASAALRQERWDEAAPEFEAAATLAQTRSDLRTAHEGWRLACHAHAQAERDMEAWRCGEAALRCGEALPVDQRAHSTLRYTGDSLLALRDRSAPPPEVPLDPDTLPSRLEAALGPGWR